MFGLDVPTAVLEYPDGTLSTDDVPSTLFAGFDDAPWATMLWVPTF
jgi:hypothetical protein